MEGNFKIGNARVHYKNRHVSIYGMIDGVVIDENQCYIYNSEQSVPIMADKVQLHSPIGNIRFQNPSSRLCTTDESGIFTINVSEECESKEECQSIMQSLVNDNNPLIDQECSICQCLYIAGDYSTFLPCSHVYHTHCIKQWLDTDQRCPLCKRNVLDSIG